MKQTDILDLESLIKKLDSIISVNIVADSDGLPGEIHVLADRNKNPKQLSRDIQSAVSAATGRDISHNIISIAQIDGEDKYRSEFRLKIAGLDISYAKNEFVTRVSLENAGEIFTGASKCITASGDNRVYQVAGACVEAVNAYLKNQVFYLYDVQKVKLGNCFATIVAVRCFVKGNEKILTGSALVSQDEYYSATMAALDAVNRVLPLLPAK